jgi:hypothetical protein
LPKIGHTLYEYLISFMYYNLCYKIYTAKLIALEL